MITYNLKKGKYVFCKNGVYFSLTKEEMKEITLLFDEINGDDGQLASPTVRDDGA